MAVKTAKQDLLRTIGAEAFDWFAAHSKSVATWSNGPAVLWGHLGCDPSGKVTEMSSRIAAREFSAFLIEAYKQDKDALLLAAKASYLSRVGGDVPNNPILGEVLTWCFGRPFGPHSQGWSDAVTHGLAESRQDARKDLRGTAGADGWLVGLMEQGILRDAYKQAFQARIVEKNVTSEAARFEARKAALKAAALKAAETRRRNAANRKAG